MRVKEPRVILVVGLLFLRLLVNLIVVQKCRDEERVLVAGKVSNIYQKGSDSIVVIGNFRVIFGEKPKVGAKNRVSVIGRCRVGVIEVLRGQISLVEPEIEAVDLLAEREGIVNGFVRSLREKLVVDLEKQLPARESGLVAGIVLGYKDGLGKDFKDALINSGTIHIAVASGYNVAVVGGMVTAWALMYLKRGWASLVAILAIIFYVLLAGGDPPVVRSGIMGSIALLAKFKGRQTSVGWTLVWACLGMIMFRPSIVEEISFQLSVCATVGLVWLEPAVRGLMERFRDPVSKLLLKTEWTQTLAAQIVTGPIIWWHFGRVSWVGLVSNLFVLPLIPAIMLVGSIQMVLNLISPVLGGVFVPLSYSLSHLVVVLVEWFGG